MEVSQTNIFRRAVKKLNKSDKLLLDEEIKNIASRLVIGDQKKGDLNGVFVYKFKINVRQYLLAYRMDEELLEFIMLGPHENYYRDLKNFLG